MMPSIVPTTTAGGFHEATGKWEALFTKFEFEKGGEKREGQDGDWYTKDQLIAYYLRENPDTNVAEEKKTFIQLTDTVGSMYFQWLEALERDHPDWGSMRAALEAEGDTGPKFAEVVTRFLAGQRWEMSMGKHHRAHPRTKDYSMLGRFLGKGEGGASSGAGASGGRDAAEYVRETLRDQGPLDATALINNAEAAGTTRSEVVKALQALANDPASGIKKDAAGLYAAS